MGGQDAQWWKRATPWRPQTLSPKNYPPMIISALTEALLYGIHVILFGICIHLLLTKRMRLQWLMLAGITIMFLLATTDVALTWNFLLHKPQTLTVGTTLTYLMRLWPKYMIFVSNNLIGVALLIARCYVVWGQQKWIALASSIPLIVATGIGFSAQLKDPLRMRVLVAVWIILSLILNNILTLMTAGRIWWLSRRVSIALGRRKQGQYRTTSAIIIESGLLYSISMLLTIGLSTTIWVPLGCIIMMRTVCIMPVLIVVQIAIGHATKSSDVEMTTGMQTRTEHHRTSPVILDTIVDTRGPDISLSSAQLTTHASTMAGHE